MSTNNLTNFLTNTNIFDISIHGDSSHCLPVKSMHNPDMHNREIPENIKQEIATFKGIKEIITVDIAKKINWKTTHRKISRYIFLVDQLSLYRCKNNTSNIRSIHHRW